MYMYMYIYIYIYIYICKRAGQDSSQETAPSQLASMRMKSRPTSPASADKSGRNACRTPSLSCIPLTYIPLSYIPLSYTYM